MKSDFVRSEVKPPGRTVWFLDSNAGNPAKLLVFLDGELYLERVCAGDVVRQLQNDARTPPLAAVFVSDNGPAARHSDYVCDADYTWFLAHELLPFLIARNPNLPSESVVLIGLSLSGLAAAHAAISTAVSAPRFVSRLRSGGSRNVSSRRYPGLFQGTSQRDSCERAVVAPPEGGIPGVVSRVPGRT